LKNELEALLDKADESLSAAKLLLDQGYAPFAASRAYYAMFYSAHSLLLDIGQSYSQHSQVIGAFGREFAKTGKLDPTLHRHLIDSQDLRNVASCRAHLSPHSAHT